MATEIEVFIGTHENFLLSFKIKKTDDETFVMERYIAHRSHNGTVLCMDTCGRYLATGGGDDKIVIIDLKLNKDVQEINRHEGSINTVLFTNDGSHLLSGSEDGRLVATKVGSWITENIWKKPHTGKAILKACLHESGKFAITLGKDGTLRGWDMFKGSQISTSNVRDLSEADIILDNVELCPNGKTFAMSGQKTVSVISFISGTSYDGLSLQSRVTSLCWLDNENLLVGMENGSIEWTNINKSSHVNLPNIHTRRIKGMHCLNGFLGTICSTGDVSLWSISSSNKQLILICTTNEPTRPTCIKLINTIENRFKGEPTISLNDLKEDTSQSVKKPKPLSTMGKIIIEMDGNDHDVDGTKSDVDTHIVPTAAKKTPTKKTPTKKMPTKKMPTKKTPTKKWKDSSDEDVSMSTSTPNKSANENSQMSKKRKLKVNVTKPIIVRSPNSDDDFEKTEVDRKLRTPNPRKTNSLTDNSQSVKRKMRSHQNLPSNPQTQQTRNLKKTNTVKRIEKFKISPPAGLHLMTTRRNTRTTQ